MSSRNHRIRPARDDRRGKESLQDERATADDDIVEDDDDFEPDYVDERRDSSNDRVTRSRRSSSPLEGTADQISRLRETMNRGISRSSPSPTRSTIGRNFLSRSAPEQRDDSFDDDIREVDDGYDEPVAQEPGQAVYRATSRRRVDTARASPSTTRVAPPTRPKLAPSPELDDDPYFDDDDDFTEYDQPRATPWQRSSARGSGTVRKPATGPVLPNALTQADLVNDAAALSLIGVGLLGLATMAIVVANQAESLAPTFATHVSASGVLQNFEHYNSLWRLPLLSAMLTLMNIAAAWFISPVDRFASRFLLAAAIIVQLVAWVALIRIL